VRSSAALGRARQTTTTAETEQQRPAAEDEEQHLPSFHGSSTCSSTSSSFSSTCSSSTCSSSTSTQCSSSWEAGAILRWGYPELFHVVMRQGNGYEKLKAMEMQTARFSAA
jgi:SET domain-containing protein